MDAFASTGARPGLIHAPAKVNLSLHVVGRQADGYHRLDGLVAFTEMGDRIAAEEADADGLAVCGPMADGVPAEGNLLEKTLRFVREAAARRGVAVGPYRLSLEKNLPVAAGLGGGSADAAALLRFFARRHPELSDDLSAGSLQLGADVPMCRASRPARIRGVGEIVEPLAALPALPMVLVNPRVPLSTPEVFGRLERRDNPPPPPLPAQGFAHYDDLLAYLGACRNDLEAPARALAPAIAQAVKRLCDLGAGLSRMSGSGATVFALFPTAEAAAGAANALLREQPGWWVVATRTLPSEPEVSDA